MVGQQYGGARRANGRGGGKTDGAETHGSGAVDGRCKTTPRNYAVTAPLAGEIVAAQS
jgi:hypothetical protein